MFTPALLNVNESIKDGYWTIGQTVTYCSERGPVIVIPEGFETNLASIPRLMLVFFRKAGKHRKSAALHDYLYSKDGRKAYPGFTREWCDEEFYLAMILCDVPKWKAKCFYWGVCALGWMAWNK